SSSDGRAGRFVAVWLAVIPRSYGVTGALQPPDRRPARAYHRGVSYASDERSALCALLDQTGPDAPTLCEGWRTRDLAAHLVLRERRPDAAAGLMGGPLAGHTRRAHEALPRQPPLPRPGEPIRTGAPALPVFRL